MGENPIIHRRKLFGGRVTAEQLHAELAWGKDAKCSACGAPPAIRIQTFVLLSDMSADTRHAIAIQVALGKLHTVAMEKGPAVRTGHMFACKGCQMSAERAAARGPSYSICHIDRGPGVDVPLISVL